jgi:hypothetical protein
MEPVEFTRLIARTIDRVCLAGASAVPADAVSTLSTDHPVDVSAVSLIATIITDDDMTWDELGVPMRYTPAPQRRGFAEHFASAGILSLTDDAIAFTDAGRAAARAYVDLMPDAIASLWQIDTARIPVLAHKLQPVFNAALESRSPFVHITQRAIRPTVTTPAYDLWRNLILVRRHRSDAHAAAWAAVGHDETTIQTTADGPERRAIEDDTNDRHAPIWHTLPADDHSIVLALLGGLNGTGTPH